MKLTLDLSPELQTKLQRDAERAGLPAGEYAKQLLEAALIVEQLGKPDLPTLRLFGQWAAEDATDDPAEIAAREREWEELKKGLEEARMSSRKLFP